MTKKEHAAGLLADALATASVGPSEWWNPQQWKTRATAILDAIAAAVEATVPPENVVLNEGTVVRALSELDSLREENRRLRGTLQVLSEHHPSWSDDFLRARAALIGVEATLAGAHAEKSTVQP